jgi:chromosome segregation ATPase
MDDANSVLLNKYIEKLNDALVDATKQKVVVEARSALLEETIKTLQEVVEQLQGELETKGEALTGLEEELNQTRANLDAAERRLSVKTDLHHQAVANLEEVKKELAVAQAAPRTPVIIEHVRELIKETPSTAVAVATKRKKRAVSTK